MISDMTECTVCEGTLAVCALEPAKKKMLQQPPFAPYWGPPATSPDWCEQNYTVSPYIAEFWNFATSIPIFALAFYGFVFGLRQRYETRVLAPLLLMSIVGLGSCAFHGTLQLWGQALDELSMIWAAASLLYAVLEPSPTLLRPWLGPALATYCSAFSVAYFYLPEYFVWFLISYIVLVLSLFFGALRSYGAVRNASVRLMLVVSALFYVGGFALLWLPDKLMCSRVQPYQFHALFHLTSTVGPWYLIQHGAWGGGFDYFF